MKPPRPRPGWSQPEEPRRRPRPQDEAREVPTAPDEATGEARPREDEGPALDDPARGTRLQKVLAAAGHGSRRACEALIEAGEVRVNGRVVDRLPVFVDPIRDRVVVGERRVRVPQDHVYVMLFKPRGVLSTNEPGDGRRLATELVRHPSRARLFPVGRLDADSSGLLLLTNDGELANRLTHPRYGVHKQYEITVDGLVGPEDVAKLERGLFLSDARATHGRNPGRRTSRSKVTILKRGRDRTRLLVELREGRNRQLRRMMLHVGHPVRRLRRIRLGPIKLTGLRAGDWRELEPKEVIALKRAAFPEEHRRTRPARPPEPPEPPARGEDR